MADLSFKAFDADNHYYEATDAFTRHIPDEYRKRGVQWAVINGKQRLMVDGKLNRFIPNPTFDPVAKPGVLDAYFRGKLAADDIRAAFGDLEPIRPEYRDRDARLKVMDEQGLEGAFLFPTLGVGMEESLTHDPDLAHAVFESFNRWLEDDWGYDDGRLFAAPMLCLLDPAKAEHEVDRVLAHGAKVVCLRSGPVKDPVGARTHGDPAHAGVWARLNEAGVVVAFHSGESGYGFLPEAWGRPAEFEAFRYDAFRSIITASRPIHDTIAALVCDGVFTTYSRIRIATIESGSDWVVPLAKGLHKMFKQRPGAFGGIDPIQQLKDHLWVSPYYEDNLRAVADMIGARRMLFGSDWPHAEGLAEPTSYADDLSAAGFDEAEVRAIMRDNALALVQQPD
ncbi:MAG: amidohydrolase [Actinomycetota bacterium]|nr:amidohydrolase family protein [Acidimicrobiia bacterium]MDQ3293392.1 amidohydrolase [Actinomycetota bacterium]